MVLARTDTVVETPEETARRLAEWRARADAARAVPPQLQAHHAAQETAAPVEERAPAVDSDDADERHAARQALPDGVRERLNAARPEPEPVDVPHWRERPYRRVATADLERLADKAGEAATTAADKASRAEAQAAALGARLGTDQAPGQIRYQQTADRLDLAAEQLPDAREADERARQLDASTKPMYEETGGRWPSRARTGPAATAGPPSAAEGAACSQVAARPGRGYATVPRRRAAARRRARPGALAASRSTAPTPCRHRPWRVRNGLTAAWSARTGRATSSALEGSPPDDLPTLILQGPGWHRMRVHASGRSINPDGVGEEPVEDYLIAVWPQEPSESVVIRSSKMIDEALPANADTAPDDISHATPEPDDAAERDRRGRRTCTTSAVTARRLSHESRAVLLRLP
ncbi:hypothetical protein AB0D83_19090 [Streptomyces decoyicus]|uniref:hypothetical protein n=1 Tax=Streptomyces decoyicus TaxID=249567 RepID=UPI0033DC5500